MSMSPLNLMPSQCFLDSKHFRDFPYWEVTINQTEIKIDDSNFLEMSDAILKELEYTLLKSEESVTNTNEMGKGALSFGALKECGCGVLGRRKNNKSRHFYEKDVIKKVESLKDNQEIRISAFATGLLFGEYALLTKIIQKLSTNNSRVQKVVYDCIDTVYEFYWDQCTAIKEKTPGVVSWNKDLKAAIPEFVALIQKTRTLYQAKFTIELRFFSQKNCLLQHSLENSTKYHLLVGADRDATNEAVEELNKKLKCPSIFLERRDDQACIQTISSSGVSTLIRPF